MSKEYYGVKDLPEWVVFRKNGEIITTMEFIEKFNVIVGIKMTEI